MNFKYLFFFFVAFMLGLLFTYFVRKLALHFSLLDMPDKQRKKHSQATPLAGGSAIFLSFFITMFLARTYLLSGNLQVSHWLGFFIGSLFLIFGGVLDDKYDLAIKYQLLFPFLAIMAVLFGGINIEKISNPMGGFFYLNNTYFIFSLSSLLIFLWLWGIMYSTKLLDGLDGLVSGVSGIGAFVIFLFTITDKYYQPDIAMASLILSASILAFLFFNWYPAKIFLGEGGSLFLGYALGVLSIISGGKIAIALLVMGIPVLDLFWTIIRRLAKGNNPFKSADRGHLHFRLSDSGLGQKKTVLIYYFFALTFGLSALFLQSRGKLYALLILIFSMFLFVMALNFLEKKYE